MIPQLPKCFSLVSSAKPEPTVEERFHEASAQIHKSVQRYMGDGEIDESSSEDDIDDGEIIQSTFKMYTNLHGESTCGHTRM